MQRITIISLGWLGLALYKELEALEYEVSGSYNTIKKNVKNEFKFDINKEFDKGVFPKLETLIINLPPSKITNKENLHKLIFKNNNKQIIFISSTSVYGMQGDVDETTPPNPETKNGERLLEWENFIQDNVKNYQIIRSAGQFGAGRHPAKFLSGRDNIPGGNKCINVISQKDLLKIILKSIKSQNSQIINATNTNHPTKEEYYTQCCKNMDLPLPNFIYDEKNEYKRIHTIHKDYEINNILTKGF